MVYNLGVDLGYAYTQGVSRYSQVKFDSYIKEIDEKEAKEIQNSIDEINEDKLLVKYQGKYYLLGKLAIRNYPSLTKRLVMNRNDVLAQVQYLTAISLLVNDINIECNLAVGLPNRSRNDKEKTEKFLKNQYQITLLSNKEEINKFIRIKEVVAIPQSVSVAFILDEEDRINNKLFICDAGFGTVDCVVLDGMQVSKEVGSRYYDRGVEKVFKMLEEEILSSDIAKKYNIIKVPERTLQSIVETGKWSINGQEQDIKPLLDKCLYEYADELFNEIVNHIVFLSEIDICIGSGGLFSSIDFTRYFANKFKEYNIIFVTQKGNPSWAVAQGLYNFSNLYFGDEEIENTVLEEVSVANEE